MATRDPAYGTFTRRSILFAITYVGATALITWLAHAMELGPLAAGLLTLLPTALLVFWVWAFGQLLFDLRDEYMRLLEIRKALIATGITLALAGGWGMVEMTSEVPKLPVFFLFPIWCAGLAIGEAYNRITGHGRTPL